MSLYEKLEERSREIDSHFIDRISYIPSTVSQGNGFIGVKISKTWYTYSAPSWIFALMCNKRNSIGKIFNHNLRGKYTSVSITKTGTSITGQNEKEGPQSQSIY